MQQQSHDQTVIRRRWKDNQDNSSSPSRKSLNQFINHMITCNIMTEHLLV